jgi:hypothetical protein
LTSGRAIWRIVFVGAQFGNRLASQASPEANGMDSIALSAPKERSDRFDLLDGTILFCVLNRKISEKKLAGAMDLQLK